MISRRLLIVAIPYTDADTNPTNPHYGALRLVGSFKLYISFAKEPYKRDDNLQKRRIIVTCNFEESIWMP